MLYCVPFFCHVSHSRALVCVVVAAADIACSGANAVLAVSLESETNPVFNIPFPGKHAKGLLLVLTSSD